MNLSYRWLKELLNLDDDVGPARLAELLTSRACPVEGIEPLPEGDARLALEVTFNRPDLLSHAGVARELAGPLGREPVLPEPVLREEAGAPAARFAAVEVEAPELCPRYTARVIRGVRVAPSPAWLARRIEAIGLRPVNNVVDVTNLVLFEVGQPLHAFDLARLEGPKIVVRRARPGEVMTAIDGSRIELDAETLVIADARRPVAVAGIMGGLESEISERTRDVLLESAYFDPIAVRRAVRRLGLRSDSSYRFERGVDPARVEWASRRAAALIQEVAGGEVSTGVIDVDAKTAAGPRHVTLRLARLRRVAGVDIRRSEAARHLVALGMDVVETDTTLEVTVPTARFEVAREADLVEEVLRCHGYDRVALTESLPIRVAPRDPEHRKLARVRDVLVGAGYREIHSLSFVEADDAIDPPLFTEGAAHRVRNPVRPETPALRRSLYGPLLRAKKTNLDKGNRRVHLFEASTVYLPRAGAQPDERRQLGVLADAGFLEVKGVFEALLAALGLELGEGGLGLAASGARAFDALEQAEVRLGAERIGYLGKVSRAAAERFDLGKDRPVVLLLDLGALRFAPRSYRDLPAFPAIVRDLAAVVDAARPWGEIEAAARAAAPANLRGVQLLSVFEGEPIPAGKKSVALRMEFRAADRTLTSEEADAGREAVKAALRARFGASFRE
jgi:phenylalanyl-tRNA synthetase beta chain